MPVNIYEGHTLTKKAFVVEETIFRNCTLVECSLFYSGGAFEWVNTSFQNCQWSFRGAAKDTISLLQTLGLIKAGQTPPPTFHVADAGKVN